ncbi:MAG: SUMF1/EgtB/PvdO family nonheme iron enzyme [Longimicrobiales bacterium]|nr:SUMF1/EgtB/PvdO family nonheme iron enzyme [Longimicrobiales bacterium]
MSASRDGVWLPVTALLFAAILGGVWLVGFPPLSQAGAGGVGGAASRGADSGNQPGSSAGSMATPGLGGSIQPEGEALRSGIEGVSGIDAGAVAAPSLPETLDGFRADAWYLPDDPLLGFVEIPGGPFLMGSDPEVDPLAYEIEIWSSGRPQGVVNVPTFYMGRFEVTVAQYAAFVEATGHPAAPGTFDAPLDHPVSRVTWPDALAYARWLEERLRNSPDTPEPIRSRLQEGWRVTLPDEAEWEKAARGTEGAIFPWGNQPRSDRANFQAGAAVSVGLFSCPECPYDLADMSGNVWEWTRSPYQPYPYDETDDHENLRTDALWVIRGGSYQDPLRNVRAAVRGGGDPGARRSFVGFRLALTPGDAGS